MKIIKIGGSAITDKKTGEIFVDEVAERVARELIPGEKYIIIHGVGYIGHKLALEYELYRGLQGNQWQWAHLRSEVAKITKRIVEILVKQGHPAVELSITNLAKAKNGKIVNFDLDTIKAFVNLGFIPVLRGDGIMDESMGLVVVSGDKIATEIAIGMNVEEIIYGTNVDGILDVKGKVIPIITQQNLEHISLWETDDFSGGMRNKLKEALRLKNTRVRVISLRKDGSLRAVLEGKNVGTLIEP